MSAEKPTPTPGWGQPVTTKKIEDVFKPAKEVAQHKTGLKILIYGREDTMKTGFGLSGPPPVYDIDTELGAPPLFQYFPEKDIKWCDATFLDPTKDIQVPESALTQFEGILTLLKDVEEGTILIDSGTDIWDWIQGWIQQVGKKKEGTLLRFEWAKAKQRWRRLLLRLFAKPVTFIMTAQPQEIYDAGGQATGRFRPRVQSASPHMFDIVIYAQRWETIHPKTKERTVRYVSEIRKCRFKKGYRPLIDEITYEKLCARLKQDLGVEVW